jgi:hypothetical protein
LAVGPVEYDPQNFRLVRSDEHVIFLGNTYQEYLRLDPAEREKLIRRFLATWHTSSKPVPEDFDDVRADILPALRARAFFEVDIHIMASAKANQVEPFGYLRDLLRQLSGCLPHAVALLRPDVWLAAHPKSRRCWSR